MSSDGNASAASLSLSLLQQVGGDLELCPAEQRLSRLRRVVIWCVQCFTSWGCGYIGMITLTYRPEVEWDKKHVSAFTRVLREHMASTGKKARYVWVAELQRRGAVHYHCLVWLPVGFRLPKPDACEWQTKRNGIVAAWTHGRTGIQSVTSPLGYIIKYASKLEQKLFDGEGKARREIKFPKGLRMHGNGGIPEQDRLLKTHSFLPQWLRAITAPWHRLMRAEGGGWVSRETGELFLSPFRIVGFCFRPGRGRCVLLERVGDRNGETSC